MTEIRIKRLIHRANYRGFKEADILLGGFAKANVHTMSVDELADFEHLLGARDNDIYAWITETKPVPQEYNTPIFVRLKAYKPEL